MKYATFRYDTVEVEDILTYYSVYKKNFTLWNLNYLQAIVLIWQLWMLRINGPQKHKVLYSWDRIIWRYH